MLKGFFMVTTSFFPNNLLFNFINNLKHLYGHFWRSPEGYYQYYLKLDGYYYCKWKRCVVAVLRVRNKRTIDIIPLNEIVNNKSYLKELHPVDACLIGILANNERNGILNKESVGWQKMGRSKEYRCFIKSDPILEISRKYSNKEGNEIVVLRSKFLSNEIELLSTELCKNHALLYALDSLETVSLGYDISELFIRNSLGEINK